MEESICALPAEECLNAASCRCRNEFGISIHFRSESSGELLTPRVEYQQWCLPVPNQETDIILELCTNFDCFIELADGDVSEQQSVDRGEPIVVSLKEMLSPSKTSFSGLIAKLRQLVFPKEDTVTGLPGTFSIKVRDREEPRALRATYHIRLMTET